MLPRVQFKKKTPFLCQLLFLVAGLAFSPPPVAGDEPSENPVFQEQFGRFNLKLKTLGGVQFWSDVLFFHDWHIQQHATTKHFRLLDGNDVRHAWGTLEECKEALEKIRRDQKFPKMSGRAVILIHGIIRSAKSMGALRKQFTDDEFTVLGFNYASTRIDIPAAADYLHQVIESLDGIERIDFVVHSMGGLVTRAYLAEHRDPRIGRMVMLGVPNLGAHLARDLKSNWLFKIVSGPAGQQLAKNPQGFAASLPTPDFEFAVIAGSRGTLKGYNPLIPGDDDGTVAVESTKLPGAADFIMVPRLHSFMMGAPDVLDHVKRFLIEGKLRANGERHPIPPVAKNDIQGQSTLK